MLSTLFNLLLANITILTNFFIIPVGNKDVKRKLARTILTGAQITVANNSREMLPLVADKTSKDLSK